jgi:hypothetical protein
MEDMGMEKNGEVMTLLKMEHMQEAETIWRIMTELSLDDKKNVMLFINGMKFSGLLDRKREEKFMSLDL